MTATERFLAAYRSAPHLQPLLMRCARRLAQGQPLAASLTVSAALSYEDQRALEVCFQTTAARGRDGRVRVLVPDVLRAPAAWQGVPEALGLGAAEATAADPAQTFQRAALLHGGGAALAEMAATPEIVRFVKSADDARAWLALYGWACRRRRDAGTPVTLSQLGSDLFGDSKSLRTGRLRRQLVLLLSILDGDELADERTLLARFDVVDNPFTTHVTVFAPFTFQLQDGSAWDFPARLFAQGLACQLPLETVDKMTALTWTGSADPLVTSENAAPFAALVHARTPALYTEGYPNTAVRKLLRLLGAAGVQAVHEGDADLDGLRIAADVRACLPVVRIVAVDVLASADASKGIPLTAAQQARLAKFLAKTPADSPLAASSRRLAELGCWYEQEAFHEA